MNFEVEKRIKILKEFADRKAIKLFISLSSSVENSNKAFFGGVRVTDFFVIISFINVSQKNLNQIYPIIDKYSDKVFVDVEKKHPFFLKEFNSLDEDEVLYSNLLGAAYQKFKYEKIIPWSPSRLTAESTISLLRNFKKGIISGLKVSLIGVGSIGLKVALYLVEEGCSVVIFNRDKSKAQNIADIINQTKSEYTIANASFSYNLSTTMASSSTIILAANDNNYISRNDLRLMPGNNKLIIDISKNSLTNEAKNYIENLPEKIIYQRVDIGERLTKLGISEFFNEQSNQFSKASSKFIIRNNKNIRIVSGGFPGVPGDYIVDNVVNPNFILGEIDNEGICRNTFEPF
jgi:hypothetical protein